MGARIEADAARLERALPKLTPAVMARLRARLDKLGLGRVGLRLERDVRDRVAGRYTQGGENPSRAMH